MHNRKIKVGVKLRRFFVDEDQIIGNTIRIVGNDVNHISNVLRQEVGDRLEVVSGEYIYISEIVEILEDEIVLEILKKKEGSNEPKTKIILYQGLPKGTKMDSVVEKGTEIGISKFYGLETQRAIVKIEDGKKKAKRIDRWQKKADSAGKQAMRDILPVFEDILNFKDLVEKLEGEKNIIVPYEDEDMTSLKQGLSSLVIGEDIHVLIGPEGGWAKEEIRELKRIGGKTVSLGKRILRTETAGPVTAALILYEFGDI